MIRCDRVRLERGGVIVVDGVSLTVPAGRAMALIGPTAAGKSALLAAVATAIPLHGGSAGGDITVAGCSVRHAPERVRQVVGYAPDRLPVWPGLGAEEFLELFAVAAGLAGRGLRTAVARALAFAGLAADPRQPLDTLPAGRAKRLLIARALLSDPEVLLLDDPCGGLDPAERREVTRVIEDSHLVGRTVLAAIDDGVVPDCFSDLAVLADGRLVTEGPNDPAAFAAGRSWTRRIVCPGRAETAATALADRCQEIRVLSADALVCRHPAAAPVAALLADLAGQGIPVESVGFDPPWTAQLLPG